MALWLLYRFGTSGLALALALLLLACPVAVIWMSVGEARRMRRDIDAAVHRFHLEQRQGEPRKGR
jgi:di/tricarboxylate transporter